MDDIPNLVTQFSQALQVNDTEALAELRFRLLSRVFTQLIPGDGTIHLDYVNTVLSTFGASFRVPDMDALRTIALRFSVPEETFDGFVAGIATLTPEDVYEGIQMLIELVKAYCPFDIEVLVEAYVLPTLKTYLASRLNFNIFWDLFLFTSFYCFACTHPKGLIGGKKLLFRCCAVFPAGWLLISSMLAGDSAMAGQLPVPLVAALSSRSLAAMMVFFLLVLFQKYGEAEFAVKDPTGSRWREYAKTNSSALQFSLFAWIVLAVVSLVDFLLSGIPGLSGWRIGQYTSMWLGGPVLLLYSYNKQPKHKWLNITVTLYYVFHFAFIAFLLIDRLSYVIEMAIS